MPGTRPGTREPDVTLGLFLAEATELLLEARQAPAAVDQVLLAAGPGRVRLRIDVEVQRVARLAPGGTGGELGAVGHDDLDGVIVRVDFGFHLSPRGAGGANDMKFGRLYSRRVSAKQGGNIPVFV